MRREHFVKVVEETLDSLPRELRGRMDVQRKQTAGFVVGFKEHGKEV
jgi:hypothetical protein